MKTSCCASSTCCWAIRRDAAQHRRRRRGRAAARRRAAAAASIRFRPVRRPRSCAATSMRWPRSATRQRTRCSTRRRARTFATRGISPARFTADGFAIASYALVGSRGNASFRLYFAREAIRLRDPARDVAASSHRHGSLRRDRLGCARAHQGSGPSVARVRNDGVGDGGRPARHREEAFVLRTRHRVRRDVCQSRHGFLTLLPYGRSVLRDDAGHAYPLIRNTASWDAPTGACSSACGWPPTSR